MSTDALQRLRNADPADRDVAAPEELLTRLVAERRPPSATRAPSGGLADARTHRGPRGRRIGVVA